MVKSVKSVPMQLQPCNLAPTQMAIPDRRKVQQTHEHSSPKTTDEYLRRYPITCLDDIE